MPDLYYDMWGKPVTREVFLATFARPIGRLRTDEVGDLVISTVFLGINLGRGTRDLYETAVLGRFSYRWSSMQEALIGHQRIWTALKYPDLARDEEAFWSGAD